MECIVEDIEEFFEDGFEEVMKESVVIDELNEYGYNPETQKEQDNKIHSLLYPPYEYPVKVLTLLVNKQLWSSYPIINYGMTYEVIIEDIIENGNLIEGQISCKLINNPNSSFSFFDTMYYKNKSKYEIGNTYSFTFNGFMYSCNKNNYEGMNLISPQKKSGIFNILNSTEEKNKEDVYLDKNSIVFSPILNVERFDVGYNVVDIDLGSFFQEYKICFVLNSPLAELEILFKKEVEKQLDKDFFDNRGSVEIQTHIREIYFPTKIDDYISLEEKFEEEEYDVFLEDIKDIMGNCQFMFDSPFSEDNRI